MPVRYFVVQCWARWQFPSICFVRLKWVSEPWVLSRIPERILNSERNLAIQLFILINFCYVYLVWTSLNQCHQPDLLSTVHELTGQGHWHPANKMRKLLFALVLSNSTQLIFYMKKIQSCSTYQQVKPVSQSPWIILIKCVWNISSRKTVPSSHLDISIRSSHITNISTKWPPKIIGPTDRQSVGMSPSSLDGQSSHVLFQ